MQVYCKEKTSGISQKTAENCANANAFQIKSGCYLGLCQGFALFRDNVLRLFQTLSAIWTLAQLGVDALCTAPVLPRSLAQVSFLDGVANAGVHARANLSWLPGFNNANGLH